MLSIPYVIPVVNEFYTTSTRYSCNTNFHKLKLIPLEHSRFHQTNDFELEYSIQSDLAPKRDCGSKTVN